MLHKFNFRTSISELELGETQTIGWGNPPPSGSGETRPFRTAAPTRIERQPAVLGQCSAASPCRSRLGAPESKAKTLSENPLRWSLIRGKTCPFRAFPELIQNNTQYSVLSAQDSVLSIQYSVLDTQCPVLSTQYSVLSD